MVSAISALVIGPALPRELEQDSVAYLRCISLMPAAVRQPELPGEATTYGNPARCGGHALRLRRPLPLWRLRRRRRDSGRGGLRKRRLRAEHFHERLIGALLVRIPTADSNG